jgi:hypothetical protein
MADGVMDGMYKGMGVRSVGVAQEEIDMAALQSRRVFSNTHSDDFASFLPLVGLVLVGLFFGLQKLYSVLSVKADSLGVEIDPTGGYWSNNPKPKPKPKKTGTVSFQPTVEVSEDVEADVPQAEP